MLVLIHHATLGYLQDIGFEKVYFTQLNYFTLEAFVLHISFSAVIFFTCGLWGYQLKKYSEIQIRQILETGRLKQDAILADEARKRELELQATALDKAVEQGKFEIASDFLHDIGNAVVGFGSYLTRVQRIQDEDNRENLRNLAVYFKTQQQAVAVAIGEPKAAAVVTMLNGLAEAQKNNREEVSRSISEQLNIISQIQEILHIQRQYISGQETQERKPVNLRRVINDCLSMLFTSLEKNSIAVAINIPEGLPDIKGDRTRLMQVMLSVLKNSLESMDGNATEKAISLVAQTQGDLLLLQVRDNGSGFDTLTGGRLFERGFTTKPSYKGLGLGNCLAIVESHAGTIDLTSEGLGKGSLTTIKFRIQAGKEAV
jgi:signal transduction histidine kinase